MKSGSAPVFSHYIKTSRNRANYLLESASLPWTPIGLVPSPCLLAFGAGSKSATTAALVLSDNLEASRREFPQEGAGAPGGRARALSEREFEPGENRTVGGSASRRALERGSYLVGWIRSRLLQRTVRFSFTLNVVGAIQPGFHKSLAPQIFKNFAKMSDKNKARVPVGERE